MFMYVVDGGHGMISAWRVHVPVHVHVHVLVHVPVPVPVPGACACACACACAMARHLEDDRTEELHEGAPVEQATRLPPPPPHATVLGTALGTGAACGQPRHRRRL